MRNLTPADHLCKFVGEIESVSVEGVIFYNPPRFYLLQNGQSGIVPENSDWEKCGFRCSWNIESGTLSKQKNNGVVITQIINHDTINSPDLPIKMMDILVNEATKERCRVLSINGVIIHTSLGVPMEGNDNLLEVPAEYTVTKNILLKTGWKLKPEK